MNETEILGYVITAVITLGAFFSVVQKFTQPINELKIVIQELRDCIASLKNDTALQNRRIEKHGEEIDGLKERVGEIETKIRIYHEGQS